MKTKYDRILLILAFTLLCTFLSAQENQTAHNNQIWVGYMTSGRISKAYSLWNDVHYVPESFAIVRTGLTRSISDRAAVTAGYAFALLSKSSEQTRLSRMEQRPWGQIQINLPVRKTLIVTNRVRYDARFRQKILDGELQDGYLFNHRVRFLLSVRKNLRKTNGQAVVPYVTLSNETLLNFGKIITYNTFDQNRLSLSFGMQKNQTQYQIGFMNRLVTSSAKRFTANHTVVFWVVQKFDFNKVFKNRQSEEAASE